MQTCGGSRDARRYFCAFFHLDESTLLVDCLNKPSPPSPVNPDPFNHSQREAFHPKATPRVQDPVSVSSPLLASICFQCTSFHGCGLHELVIASVSEPNGGWEAFGFLSSLCTHSITTAEGFRLPILPGYRPPISSRRLLLLTTIGVSRVVTRREAGVRGQTRALCGSFGGRQRVGVQGQVGGFPPHFLNWMFSFHSVSRRP